MNNTVKKKLFFSMTLDFLETYIPQDSPSLKTVKTYRDGLSIFRRYVSDEKGISMKRFLLRIALLTSSLTTGTGCSTTRNTPEAQSTTGLRQ